MIVVISVYCARWASQVSLVVKNPLANARDIGDISMEDPLGEGMATHSQYSCLGNFMDKGVWWATVHGATKSWT